MSRYTIIKLTNLTPIHVGTGKENYDFSSSELHSDTLSAAIAAIRVREGKTEKLDDFLNSFTVSSAFPFVDNCFFLPKPFGKIDVSVSDMEEYLSRKKLKKIKYLESNLWYDVVSGKKIEIAACQIKDDFVISKDYVDKFEKPFKTQVNQRVSVPRTDNEPAEPFFFEWKYFNPHAGLYCILDTLDDSLREEIIEVFGKLGEVGIGTDKNIGGGKFSVEIITDGDKEWFMKEVEDANAQMLLSLYIPTEEELPKLNLQDSRYELLMRGGYISGSIEQDFSHLRKKSVYAFNVGSVFMTTFVPIGKIVNLRPEWNDERMHPVFRSGKPFSISIKI